MKKKTNSYKLQQDKSKSKTIWSKQAILIELGNILAKGSSLNFNCVIVFGRLDQCNVLLYQEIIKVRE